MEDEGPRFRVNGKDYPMPSSFTVGEMVDAERYFGVEFGSDAGGASMRMAAAMLWIAVRREDPTVTVDDIRALPPEVFAAVGEAAGDAGPPELTPVDAAKNGSSGESTATGSDPPAEHPNGSGHPGSATGVTSDPTISLASRLGS